MDRVEIGMGKLYISRAPNLLSTSSIGSCVAVCLWSQSHKVGGLAHIMLPRIPNSIDKVTEDELKYGDIAIKILTTELTDWGVPTSALTAKIVGGANMFPGIQARSQKVGEKNVENIKQILSEYNIPIAAEEIGGSTGRGVLFDLSNGIVTIEMTI